MRLERSCYTFERASFWRNREPSKSCFWVTQGRRTVGISYHSGTTSQNTWAYTHSLSQLPIFQSLHLIIKRKPRIFTLREDTSVATSLAVIVLESLQSMDTPWEEIPEDWPSRGNSSLDFENLNGESSNQNFLVHSMANVPPPGGNQPPPPPLGGNQPPPTPGALPPSLACIGCCSGTQAAASLSQKY